VTVANKFAGRIHDRMPVFLQPDHFAAWLDGSAGPDLLKPAREELLQLWPVSKRVNRPGNDEDVSFVDPIEVVGF
jgi:putative SOS response-associated peptidase YedK